MKRTKPSPSRGQTKRPTSRSSAHHRRQSQLHRQIREARPLHHRIALHPLSILTLLACGVLITGWTIGVAADSYNVTAKVPAPALTEGATITDPADGAATQSSPITVSGTCPDNSYVTLTRNGVFSGVAWCASNTFSIQSSLSAGANTMLAQDYNITDDPGPTTSGITITYTPPAVPASTPTTPPAPVKASGTPTVVKTAPTPLLATSAYHFQAFTSGSSFSWAIRVEGGTAPYVLQTDWGDKRSSTQTLSSPQTVTIAHTYAHPGYYPIIIRLTDAQNTAAVLQLAAIIKQPGAATAFGELSTGTSGTPTLLNSILDAKSWLWVAWPAYITLVLMAVSFWLGERQELRRLPAPQRPVSRHR